jgi:protein SCO1/2
VVALIFGCMIGARCVRSKREFHTSGSIMDRRIFFVGLGSFLLIGIVAVWTIFFGGSGNYRGTTYGEPYPVAPEFTLTRGDGTSFQLSQMRGNIVMLFFGYTSCPDICPTTLAGLKQALGKLDESDAKQVKVLFVTVDPKRDTPERMQEYVNNFNTDFIGLSGTETDLQKIWNDYGIYREISDQSTALGYIVNHTARVTVIDRNGKMRISFGTDMQVDDIVHDLKLMLKEKE